MAKAKTAPKAQAPTKAPASPMQALALVVAAPVAATTPAQPTTPVAAPAAPLPPVTVGGQVVATAANVQRRVATLGNVGNMGTITLTAGRPCRVRVPYTIACYDQCMAALTAAGGTATGAALAQASTGDFVKYATKNGWLVAVKG